jgi:hypothetical protein
MNDDKGNLGLGLLICWGCNITHLALGWFLILTVMPVGVVVFGGVGVVQLAYVIPLYMHLKNSGKTNTMKGVIIAASITALLNVGCWTQFRVGG